MKPNAATSQTWQPDQRPINVVDTWNTPYTPLCNNIASNGIIFELREPKPDGTFTLLDVLGGALGSVASGWANAANSNAVIESGRIPNVIAYWAGGAPGYWGASVNQRVALHFTCKLRSTSGRSWFDSSSTIPQITFACAGFGRLRIVKNGTTDLLPSPGYADISEIGYLNSGMTWTNTFALTTGDQIDIYYVQDQTAWGGLVVKAVLGATPDPLNTTARKLAVRSGIVLGCGFMDDGTPPTKTTLQMIGPRLRVENRLGQTPKFSFSVPLFNPEINDGIGWEWVRDLGDTTGFLRSHNPDGSTYDLRRRRLIRVQQGFQNWNNTQELFPSFTGFTDDFSDITTGVAQVTCLGIEQQAVDQFVKNFPDKISYMTYEYRKMSGTSEPVFDIPAYDNWPMEYAMRDLMIRAGIDESRMLAPLTVPQANGTSVPVIM